MEHQAAGRREGRGGHIIRLLSSTLISNTARLEGRKDFWIAKYLGHGSIVIYAKVLLHIGLILINSPEICI